MILKVSILICKIYGEVPEDGEDAPDCAPLGILMDTIHVVKPCVFKNTGT